MSWGLALRLIVATLPFAIAKVAQYIINGIAGVLRGHPLQAQSVDLLGHHWSVPFWHLVAAEVGLNVFLGLITARRSITRTRCWRIVIRSM